MHKFTQKLISIGLACMMLVSMTPTSSIASEPEEALPITDIIETDSVIESEIVPELAAEPEQEVRFKLSVKTENGTALFENNDKECEFSEGEQVDLHLAADANYQFDSVEFLDNAGQLIYDIFYTMNEDGSVISFPAPAKDVEIRVLFKEMVQEKPAEPEEVVEEPEDLVEPEVVEEPAPAEEPAQVPEEQVESTEEVIEEPEVIITPEIPEETSEQIEEPVIEEPESEEPAIEEEIVEDPTTEDISKPEEETEEVKEGSVAIRLLSEGGKATIKTASEKYSVQLSDGKVQTMDQNGNMVADMPASDYSIVLSDEVGSTVEITVVANDSYQISEYKSLIDTGDIAIEEANGKTEYSTSLEIQESMQAFEIGFEKTELYPVEGFDFNTLANLDFSSCRIMVGTSNEDIFVDKNVIVSSYKNIYLLQFDDQETAKRAYAYYSMRADMIEVDTGISIAEGEAAESISTDTVMTENANPFSELEEAVVSTGFGSYDIALIDTGANGADESVSVIGDYTGDDNGHGTSMLQYIKEQNPNARVLSIKALGADGKGDISALYAALQYAMEKNVRIINLSVSALASADSEMIENVINEASARDIIVVGAAGNNGKNAAYYVPGGIASAMIIGASDKSGGRISTSNYGSTVDYNVVAEATSEAAAKFAGWLSAHSMDELEDELNHGLIFATDYDPAEDEIELMPGALADGSGPGYFVIQANNRTTVFKSLVDVDHYIDSGSGDERRDNTIFFMNVETGTISYCMDITDEEGATIGDFSGTHSPEISGEEYYEKAVASNKYGYVLFNGYPNTKTIAGTKFSDGTDARLATAVAIWMMNPNKNLTASWLKKVLKLCYDTSSANLDKIINAGIALATEAKAYTGGTEADGYASVWYSSSSTDKQRQITPKFADLTVKKDVLTNPGTVTVSKSSDDTAKTFVFYVTVKDENGTIKTGTYKLEKSNGDTGKVNGDGTHPNSTFSLKAGQSIVIKGIPAGYTVDVTETDYSAYTTKVSVNGKKAKASLTGSVTIPKDTKATTRNFTFTVTFSDGRAYKYEGSKSGKLESGSTITLKDGQYIKFPVLPEKVKYTITEDDVEGYTKAVEGDRAATMAASTSYVANYKNTYTPEDQTIEFTNIETPGDVSFGSSLSYESGKVVVKKNVEPASTSASFAFTAEYGPTTAYGQSTTFTLTGGAQKELSIPAGYYYRITENDYSSNGYTTSVSANGTSYSNGRVLTGQVPTVSASAPAVTFKITGLPAGTFDWFIDNVEQGSVKNGDSISVPAGKTAVIKEIPRGAVVTATETAPTASNGTYAASNNPVSATVVANQVTNMGTVVNVFTPATCNAHFKNIAPGNVVFSKTVSNGTGALTVAKTVDGEFASTSDVFTFTLYVNGNVASGYSYTGSKSGQTDSKGQFTLSGGQSVTISGIPAGATYRVVETMAKDSSGSEPYETTVTDAAGTTSKAKEVSGTIPTLNANQTFSFKVSGLGSISYAYGIYNNTNASGSAASTGAIANNGTITLKGGQSAKITGIAAGSNITVTETVPTVTGGTWTANATSRSGSVSAGQTTTLTAINNAYNPSAVKVSFRNTRNSGYATLKKVSQSNEFCQGNRLYSLAGAVYEIYNSDSNKKVATLTTKADGTTDAVKLPTGTYHAVETKASPGHEIDKYVKDKDIKITTANTSSNPAVFNSSEPVKNDPLVITVNKITDGNYKYPFPLDGVVFEIKHYDNLDKNISGTPLRTWKIGTKYNASKKEYVAALDDNWLIAGSDPLYKLSGTTCLPLGTYSVQEISTVAGYTLKDGYMYSDLNPSEKIDTETGKLVFVVNDENGAVNISTGNLFTDHNEPVIIDTVALASVVEGADESHLLDVSKDHGVISDTVSLENLKASTQYRLTGQLYDKATASAFGDYKIVKEFTTSEHDTETISMKFFVNGISEMAGHVIVVGELLEEKVGDQWIAVAEETDMDQEKQSIHLIEIKTTLVDQATKDHVVREGEVDLTDTVAYTGLIPGVAYKLSASLIDKDTEETVATAEKSFTPESANGTVDVTFHYTTTQGQTLVAFEKLYDKDSKLLATHEDIDDEDQTVDVPELSTSLKDSVDEDRDALATEEIKLIDTVTYKNLVPGKEYTMKGVLMNKATGEKALDDNGDEITSEATFTPEFADGTIDIEFTFSGLTLAGESVVAFETLVHNDVDVAVHADIEDDDQTVDIPEIGTTLVDTVDEDKDALAAEEIILKDTVAYKNLVVGREYVVRGVLMDKETGEKALDDNGDAISGETTFTAESKDGTVEVIFTFSGVSLAGHSVVAFEDLYRGEKHVAVHADIEDDAQLVDIPKLETTLKDSVDGDDDAFATTEITLVDVVNYENLFVEHEYTVKGILMDKETGEPALDDNGEEITSEATFIAESANGSVELEFTFSGVNLAGHPVVAFENLYRGEKLVGVHADIEDEEQTVHVPEIKTTLTDTTDDEHDAFGDEEITLTDAVQFKDLIPEREYTVYGKLMDQATGEPVLDDEGNEITAEGTFTPEEANGITYITFTFLGTNLRGHSVVAFEELYRGEKQVAVHADINDLNQTVDIPNIATTLEDSIDNDKDALASEDVVLVDTIIYENLIVGKEYTVKGILMDKDTGEAALDDNGEEITAFTEFIPEEKNGQVPVTFRFSGLKLAGHSVVAFEDLFTPTKKVAVHADIDDDDQKVDIPKIRTSLADVLDGDKDALASKDITLIDTVTYENLIVGREYTVRGILMDKTTGEAVLDDEEQQIEAEATFTPEERNGTVDITFNFSGVSLADRTLVAFERLYRDEKIVGIHCDINDFDQSNWLPKIETTLKDTVDNDDDAFATEDIKLIDVVTYKNLLPGREYEVTGKLMDRSTGSPALDDNGEEITSNATFVAEEANGSVEIVFEFSGVCLAGHSVVAFENLYRDGKRVAVHADINDDDQTVQIPKIGTTLVDTINKEHDALADEEITLVDTVKYENLIIGREYTVKGVLMDKATGEPALDDEGNEITGETAFKAEAANGIVEVVFTFSGSVLEGHTVVAFEDLFRGEKHVAVHADIEDEDQMVYIPKVRTTLKDTVDSDKDAFAGEKITLVDTVIYENLLPGKEYVVSGILMDKATGEPADDDAIEDIVSEVTFIPEEPNGSVDLVFEFSGVSLAGHSVVAFETISRNNKEVAVHANINDKDQTVDIPLIRTSLTDTKTGLRNAMLGDKVVLVDNVEYKNLIVGREYTMKGVLMSKATGKAILNKDGSEVTASQTFVAEAKDGTIALEFTLDNIPETGIIAVAFESLIRTAIADVTVDDDIATVVDDKEVAVHQDLDDDAQTVCIPAIRTRLTTKTGLKTVNFLNKVVLRDKVVYKNLYPGHTYTMEGRLVDKETGKMIVDASGKEVSASAKFKPETADGSITIQFEFDAPEKLPNAVVAFETLLEEDKVIAEHKDLEDEEQTVKVVYIRTIAHGKDDVKTFEMAKNNVVIDTVEFKGLDAGQEYILHATLMDKETEKPVQINGSNITADLKFKPESNDGKADVEIKVPAGAFSGTAVVFEELLDGNNGNVICTHEDIEDLDQTVYFTSLKTVAKSKADGQKSLNLTVDQIIVDEATYTGLQPGHEYVITGQLINKQTGKIVTTLGKPITTELAFTPEAADGVVNVELTVPYRTVKGDTVVFEVIKDKATGNIVCAHQDINDADQTVNFFNVPKTGDTNNTWLWIVIAGVAALAIVAALWFLVLRKSRK